MKLLRLPVIATNLIQMNIKKGTSDYRLFPMFLMLFAGMLIGGKLILQLNFQTFQLLLH